jgi:Trypsin-co-occurring domain 1
MQTRREMPGHAPRPPCSSGPFAGLLRFPPEVIVLALRWYLRFGLSYWDIEELLAERGVQGGSSAEVDEAAAHWPYPVADPGRLSVAGPAPAVRWTGWSRHVGPLQRGWEIGWNDFDTFTGKAAWLMAEFVRYVLDDGSEVFFESAESDLVALHGGQSDVVDGGRLNARLEAVAQAASRVSESLRSRLKPDDVELTFGLKVSGELGGWFFAKAQTEGTINVKLTWKQEQVTVPGE